MPVQWNRGKDKDFDALPPRQPRQNIDPEWEELMDFLASGLPASISYAGDEERTRLPRIVGRRAAGRGFRVEFRDDEQHKLLWMRKSADLTPEERERSKGGRRKQAAVLATG